MMIMPTSSDMLLLTLIENGHAHPRQIFSGPEVHVGRSSQADLRIVQDAISRQHLCFTKAGEQWLVTNLSRNGTMVHHQPLGSQPVAVRAGQRFQLAHGVELWVEQAGAEIPLSAPADREVETSSPQLNLERDQPERTRMAEPLPLRPRRNWLASLRPWLKWVVPGALGLAVFFIARPVARTDAELVWPEDAQGAMVRLYHPVDGGGEETGRGFDVLYPDPSAVITTSADATTIECRIGPEQTPFRIVLEIRNLSAAPKLQGLEDFAQRWQQSRYGSNEALTFAQERVVQMWGNESGVPYLRQAYTSQDGVWAGVAWFARHAGQGLVLRAEVPFAFQHKADDLIYRHLLRFSPDMEQRWWQPVQDPRPVADIHDEMSRLSQLARKLQGPDLWRTMQRDIQNLLSLLLQADDSREMHEAEDILQAFRQAQQQWFHKKQLAFQLALNIGNHEEAARIKEQAAVVFNDDTDLRYHLVRMW